MIVLSNAQFIAGHISSHFVSAYDLPIGRIRNVGWSFPWLVVIGKRKLVPTSRNYRSINQSDAIHDDDRCWGHALAWVGRVDGMSDSVFSWGCSCEIPLVLGTAKSGSLPLLFNLTCLASLTCVQTRPADRRRADVSH